MVEAEDSFVLKLYEERDRLQACQQERGLSSCLACEKTIGCPLRQSYVRAAYESMSKGQGGGFDFQ